LPPTPFFSFDKVVHIVIYLVFSFTLSYAVINQNQPKKITIKQKLFICILSILFGGFMEILQEYIFINRYGSWYDFLANAIGAIIGILIFPYMYKLLPLKR